MKRKSYLFLIMVFWSALWVNQLCADNIPSNWVGPDEGSWFNPANWNPPGVPDYIGVHTYSVTINTNSRIRIDSSNRIEITSLTCSGDVDLEKIDIGDVGSTWLHTGTLTNHGELEFSGSARGQTIIIDNTLTNVTGGTLKFNREMEFDGAFTFTNDPGALLLIFPNGNLSIEDGDFINNGTIAIFQGIMSVNNELLNNTAGIIQGSGIVSASSTLNNQGTINSSLGDLLLITGGTFLNSGIIRNTPMTSIAVSGLPDPIVINNTGILETNMGGGIAFHGNLNNTNTGTVDMKGGALSATTIAQAQDGGFYGFGGLTGDVSIDPDSTLQFSGPTNVIGDVMVGSGATLEIKDGQTLITGHTTNNGTIHIKSGTVIFQGGLTDNGTIIYESSDSINAADFNHSGSVDGKDLAVFANEMGWTF